MSYDIEGRPQQHLDSETEEARRQLARIERGAVDALAPHDPSGSALGQVERMQAMLVRPRTTGLRRLLIIWFRVFVRTTGPAGGKERVNVRIPIPIPLVGALMPRRPSARQALEALRSVSEAEAEHGTDAITALGDYVDSVMAYELVRVDETKPSGKRELVVVGFD